MRPRPVYLLDTNVCIDFLNGRSEALRGRVRRHVAQGLAMSAISFAELRVGARTSADRAADDRRLDLLASVILVRDFDRAAADAFARIARRHGGRRNSFDRLIAAHALALDLTLVTGNEADFAGIDGLRIENWAA